MREIAMLRKYRFLILLGAVVVTSILVSVGEVDNAISLRSILEVWADVVRDADQIGLRVTRLSDEDEMELGRKIGNQISRCVPRDSDWQDYVSAVGQSLTPYVRRKGIRYEFHVIRMNKVNAFALPGGEVFVMTGLLEFVKSEAELAAVLGHEMAHVDLRHCIELFQYQLALKKLGIGEIGQVAELLRRVYARGYRQYQEFEADAQGIRLCMEAGYDGTASEDFFRRLEARRPRPGTPKARTPVGEVAVVLGEAMGSYFDSHPPPSERARRLKGLIASNRKYQGDRPPYKGVENLRQRVPRSVREFEEKSEEPPPEAKPAPRPTKAPDRYEDRPKPVPVPKPLPAPLPRPVPEPVPAPRPVPEPAPAPRRAPAPRPEPRPTPGTRQIILEATEDAYVRKLKPGDHYGDRAYLSVDGGSEQMGDWAESIAYLRFRLNIPGKPIGARLRLRVSTEDKAASEDAGVIRVVGGTWSEKTVTYQRRPSLSRYRQVGTVGRVAKGETVERELELSLKSRGYLSLAIVPNSLDGARFCSRESAFPPELVVTYEAR